MQTVFAEYITKTINPKSVFEYGCQSLDDILFYRANGIEADGFNPFIEGIRIKPDFVEVDVVTIIYGLNRMPHRSVRIAAIHESYSYVAKGGLLVAVTYSKEQITKAVHSTEWIQYKDGFIPMADSIMFQTGIDRTDLLNMFNEAQVPVCLDCLKQPITNNGLPIQDIVILATK